MARSAATVSLLLVLATACLLLAVASAKIEPKCKHERTDAVECAIRYLDLNGDDLLSRHELEMMRHRLLYPHERLAMESVATVLAHCDHDKDGYISAWDFEQSKKTCLNTCTKVDMFFEYICERAAKGENHDRE